MPALSPNGINLQPVAAWIATLGLGAAPPLSFRRFGSGRSNLTYLVSDADGRRWVLRRAPTGSRLSSAHDIEREHRILTALKDSCVPVPATIAFCADEQISDVPLVLMEHVDGLVLDDVEAARDLQPIERAAVSRALVATLARIHAVGPSAVGLGWLARQTPYATRQIKRWHGQWQQSRTRELPMVDELAERLRAASPTHGPATIVHGDFHLQNVIVSPSGGSVRAVLDWELSTLGDPLADLGGLLAYWDRPGDYGPPVFRVATLPGFLSREQLADAYAEHSGRSIESLGFWHSLALWKLAIIGEGVMRRQLRNPSTRGDDGRASRMIDTLIVRAQHVADAAGV
jgi:aminoglycoside phosphotransferase (APT) family kinase protein